MPKILVVKLEKDVVHDEIECSQEELGGLVEKLYQKLNYEYSIEVRHK